MIFQERKDITKKMELTTKAESFSGNSSINPPAPVLRSLLSPLIIELIRF